MIDAGAHERLRRHFRDALSADPVGAYRDWFRTQEELRERGDAHTARLLADDLWGMLPGLLLEPRETRARFLHNAAVFYGSPGPAADLGRARSCFAAALDHFRSDPDTGWHARALHNFATALSNLGASAEELRESVALFDRALEWRTSEREIARGVSLHNLGLARRRLAELDPENAPAHLAASAEALREAVAIRSRHNLAEGRASSQRHLDATQRALADLAAGRSEAKAQAEAEAR